jgi:hypothetical protein
MFLRNVGMSPNLHGVRTRKTSLFRLELHNLYSSSNILGRPLAPIVEMYVKFLSENLKEKGLLGDLVVTEMTGLILKLALKK